MKVNEGKVDLFISGVLYAVFIFLYQSSRNIPGDSLFFVNLSIWALFVLNTLYCLKTIRKSIKTGRHHDVPREFQWANFKRVWIVIAVNAVYVFVLIPFAGFYLASVVTLFAIMYFLGLRRMSYGILLPTILPLTIYLIFEKLLHIPLSAI